MFTRALPPPSTRIRRPLRWLLLLCAATATGAACGSDAEGWAGSASCRSCHQDHYASWYRTYHRTMTQEATERSVLGAFDGREVTYWGRTIRPVKRDGRFYFEYLDGPGGRVTGVAEVRRTVGSHRYQQYLSQTPETGGNYIRLHLLWHIGEQRWVHINGAFLYADDQGFNDHVSTWNHNCIFCHNTGPQPGITNYEALHRRIASGERIDFLARARYASQVAELGIACEACHGPGAAHARRMRNPVTRYLHHLQPGLPVDDIVHPGKLPPARSSQVCGQCHAQRVPESVSLVETWLKTGPTYRPGDDLDAHVDFIGPDTPGPPGRPDLYRLRFWPDGTPRLSAYEYTGLRRSACHTRGGVRCIDCHQAHGGSPEGMISEPNRRGANCTDCHAAIAADRLAHTRHAADTEASDCVSCHMPRIVYGVMAIHRSHDIETPAPLAQAADNRPETCTSCHLDRSAAWAADAIAAWRGAERVAEQDATPEWLKQLLGGDPVQRAVAAEAAGRPGIALQGRERAWLVAPLLSSLADDYPAVRRFAANSLRALNAELALGMDGALAAYDFIAAPEQRREIERALWRRWRAVELPPEPTPDWLRGHTVDARLLASLRARAGAHAQRIEIGE